MLNRVILFLLLFGTWLVLSGFFNPFFLSLGLFSCLLSVLVTLRMSAIRKHNGHLLGFVLRFPSYLIWLLKEIILSSFSVAIKMWQLEPEVSPEISWISTGVRDDLALTVYGTSITLTPGTVSTGVRKDGMIQVHALNKAGLDSLRAGAMNARVVNLLNKKTVI